MSTSNPLLPPAYKGDLEAAEAQLAVQKTLEGAPFVDLDRIRLTLIAIGTRTAGDQEKRQRAKEERQEHESFANDANDTPYAKYYSPDAEIWSLYLDETKAEDDQFVDLWKNVPDSLLVFVGVLLVLLQLLLT
jgi:hypothetical protein